MAEEVASYEFGVVLHHAGQRIAELRWDARTAEMSDDDFKSGLELLATAAESHSTKAILIDATAFRHEFGPGIMQWRDATIIPRYAAAGVTKFAFHMPAGYPDTAEAGREPEHEGPAPYPTQWFAERERALAWLGEGAAGA